MNDSARDARALLATCVAAAVRASEVIRAGAERIAHLEWGVKAPSDFVTDEALFDVVVRGDGESVLRQLCEERVGRRTSTEVVRT